MRPLVVVLLGTDHHRFDRLVDWADEVALLRPDLSLLVQHGSSRAPTYADGQAFLPHRELLDRIEQAAAVACHGGPGTIMDARGAGHLPVCVPRDPALGEHVDGHQIRFAALAARAGVVRTVDRVDQFHAALHGAVGSSLDHEKRGPLPPNPAIDAARQRLVHELDRLVGVAAARRAPPSPGE